MNPNNPPPYPSHGCYYYYSQPNTWFNGQYTYSNVPYIQQNGYPMFAPTVPMPSFPQEKLVEIEDSTFARSASTKNEILSVDNLLSLHPLQKKCKRCSRYYHEGEDESKCIYHSGHYRTLYQSSMKMVKFSAWSCCESDSREATGCQKGKHVEDKETTTKLNRFNNNSTTILGSKATESQNLIDLEFVETISDNNSNTKQLSNQRISKDQKIEKGDEYFTHYVKFTDTIVGLSLKYCVTVEEIKRINKIGSDKELWTRSGVKIPNKGNYIVEELSDEEKQRIEMDLRKRLVLRFTKWTSEKVTQEEATYYLESNVWNFENAVNEYEQDLLWQKQNRHLTPIPISKKVY